MRIIVCLKLIIDPDIVEFNVSSEELENFNLVLNPIDRYVLEEALTLKGDRGGEVIAVSVAPPAGDEILRDALLNGADRTVRLWHDDLSGADTWMVSQVIKEWIGKTRFDLILCGARSQDTGSGYMAAALGDCLNISMATGIIELEVGGDNKLIAHKKLPRGERETYCLEMPAILGLEEGINEPRYVAPFSRIYREGLKKKVEFMEAHPGGLDRRIDFIRYTASRPRVKVGINISGLSKADTRKMMRGELGRKKELFLGPSDEAAKKIFAQLRQVQE